MPPDSHRRDKPASIRDIARRAGVSVTTVSHALSGKRYVAPATVKKIRALVPELGYVPYAAARSLQAGRTLVLGLVIPDIANQFFGSIAKAVEEVADAREYGVILCASKAKLRREQRYFNLLRSRSIDGLIYIAGAANADEQLIAVAERFPIVIADERVPGVRHAPFVGADHRAGGRLAGEHLRALGHSEVAVVTGPEGLPSTTDRLAGFHEHYPDADVVEGDFSEESGRVAARRILENRRTATAVFATNDLMALGVMAECSGAGLVVPRDMSVIGFDDIDSASRVVPALTTVRQPASEIGRAAATVLIDDLLAGKRAREVEPLEVSLVRRDSTCRPPG